MTTPHSSGQCRVCGEQAHPFGKLRLLAEFDVSYFRCGRCEYVQTEHPYWLETAYSEALSALDVGAVDRNLRFAGLTAALISAFLDPNARFLDYGGGHGLFVRLMRDRGYDFFWSDKFASNCYARGFEAQDNAGPIEAVTAFEVFEHLTDPAGEIEAMLHRSRNLIFSTMLLPAAAPPPGNWSYYMPESGQHVGIFSRQTLAWLATRHRLHFSTDGHGFHMFSESPVRSGFFSILAHRKTSALWNALHRRPPLIGPDFLALQKRGAH